MTQLSLGAMSDEGRPGATRHPTSLWLSPDDLARLAVVAARTGYSRTEVMRILLRIGLRLHADELAPKDRRAPVEVRPPPDDGRAAAAA